MLMEIIKSKLDLRAQGVKSPEQVWKIYDEVLNSLARDMGTDVSRVIRLQSLNEMELKGCMMCPLCQRELAKDEERWLSSCHLKNCE